MKKLFFIGLLLLVIFQISCNDIAKSNKDETNNNNISSEKVFRHFYGEKIGALDSLINFANLKPDTSFSFVTIIFDRVFCNPCKAEASAFLNELFPKINGLPRDNVLILTEEFRHKEIPLFKKEDYPLNNWDTLHLEMSNRWNSYLKKKFNLEGSSMLVFNTKGKVVFTKQFVEYFDDVDSVASIIKAKNP